MAEKVAPYVAEAMYHANELKFKEQMLGKGLIQPFDDSNSGSRKLMFSVHVEQALPLVHAEVPFIMTGYEQGYDDRSSSIVTADANYEVVGKISKFMNDPNRLYYLILRNIKTNELDVYERKEYFHTSETHGITYNNSYVDNLDLGYTIPKGDIIRCSTSYDENMNHMASVNLLSTYVATDITMEDSIWISESAQKKLTSRFYKHVTVNINDNDILLNLMGDADHYKSFPNIGEKVQNGILCAVRREKTEDSLFSQSVKMLQTILMSDDKFTPGDKCTVIDIDIACNNPEILRSKYSNSQVSAIYDEHLIFIKEFVDTVNQCMYEYHTKKLSYKLDEMRYKFQQELNGVKFREQKAWSGTRLDFYLMEENVPSKGDKLSNRYGGKGVISRICPDNMMPRLALTGEPLELLFNSSTCLNRLNPGQFHELSLTHIGKCICDLSRLGYFDTNETFHEIVKLLSFCSPKEAEELSNYLNSVDEETRDIYLQSILDDGNIIMSIKPMSESMDLDMLDELYSAFPYITQRQIVVPIESSTGDIRYIPARRPGVVGHLAIFRLQQYAKEKHSVTALATTNLKNENSRTKANKYYKSTHQATPINMGNMELSDLGHMGFEKVIEFLMIHSVSPRARRLVESIFTDDPYLVDIKLDDKSRNRSAEILAAYMKAIGYRLVFEKIKKTKTNPVLLIPVSDMVNRSVIQPVLFIPKEERYANYDTHIEWKVNCEKISESYPVKISPVIDTATQNDPDDIGYLLD